MSQKISSVMVTTRKIINEETGIDLHIYDQRRDIASRRTMKATFYNLIVVSNLPELHAKSGQTVQFTLDKSHAEFESLHASLSKKFSGTLFPEMPNKPIAILDNPEKARVRKIALDKFVKFCAESTKVAKSEILRKFLRVKNLEDENDDKEEVPEKDDVKSKTVPVTAALFKDSVDTKVNDLFAEDAEQEEASHSVKETRDILQTDQTRSSIKQSAAKLFGGNIDEPDLAETTTHYEQISSKNEEGEEEGAVFSSDFNESDDDFEQLMSRLENAKKTRAEREKSLSEKNISESHKQRQEEEESDIGDITADDVAKYISENSANMDQLDLGL